jgi:uncharacterized protein (DUF1330 family)
MANPKIKPHVFHGIYSNNGYYPTEILEYFYADRPLHKNRAIFGGKDPFTPWSSRSNKIIEFKTKQQALEWYKKTKYINRESTYRKIENEGSFCNNYFIISEKDFPKYRQYFNGMIKSVKMDFNVNVVTDGNYHYTHVKDKCDSDSKSLSWFHNVNLYVSSDSSLSFSNTDFQGRYPGNILEDRRFKVNEYAIQNDTEYSIYKNNWIFDRSSFKNLFFPYYFPYNSTRINDPIIPKFVDPELFSHSIDMGGHTYEFGTSVDQESSNLGTYSVKIDQSETVKSDDAGLKILLTGKNIIYIRSLKIYLCFIELDIKFNNNYYAATEEDGSSPVSPAGLGGPAAPKLYSTDDEVSIQDKPTQTYGADQDYFPVEKKSIQINIFNQRVQIEVWEMSQKRFTWSENKGSITTPWGSFNYENECYTASFTDQFTFQQPFIQINGWDQTDFDKNLIYPPKIQ